MKTLLLLALIMAFGLLQTQGSLQDFRRMTRLVTGKTAPASYGSYGCYCGPGGQGAPKDATDRCCAKHDCCYQQLRKMGCGTNFLGYRFTYRNGQVICGKLGTCQSHLCHCDKIAALCFKRNLKTYDKKYQFYNKTQCEGNAYQC